MSIAIALRNSEGVLLATDSLTSELDQDLRLSDIHRTKIRWLRGHRAACALFPVEVPSDLLLAKPDPEPNSADDLRAVVLAVYEENVPHHFGLLPLGTLGECLDATFENPSVLVAGRPPSGPVILRIFNGGAVETGPTAGCLNIGAWNELGDQSQRLNSVPWTLALQNMAMAKKLVLDLMRGYITDYEKSEVQPKWGAVIGGTIHMATITKKKTTLETYE